MKSFKFLLIIMTVLLFTSLSFAENPNVMKLTVLHWNDFHAKNTSQMRTNSDGDSIKAGGAANLGAYLKHYRNFYEHTIELNAGDDYQGSPISMVTKGHSQVELQNLLAPDAFTVGNHEFDYGWDELQRAMAKANFPVLLGNVVVEETNERLFDREAIVNIDGIKVGVIGVVTENLKGVTTAKVTKGLKVLPKADVVRASLDYLNPITDIQIVLSHSGLWEDSVLAEAIGPEVELIIGGHSHTRLREPKIVNDVAIVQANALGRYLGIVEMEIDTLNNELVSLTGRIEKVYDKYPVDEEIASVVEAQEKVVAKEMNVQIAVLETPWTRGYNDECNLGNWITDAFRKYTGADLAFVNGGGIRKNLDPGPVTIGDILEISPFSNELMRFEMTGKQVKEFVLYQAKEKQYLQMSGMRYVVKDGKIEELKIGDQEVIDDKLYSVVTLNYVTDHIDRFFGLDPNTTKLEQLYLIDRDVLAEIAKEEKTIRSYVENRAIVE